MTAALCASGCVAQNPAFQDTTGSTGNDSGRSTSGTGGPTGAVTDTSASGTTGGVDSWPGTSGSSGLPASTGKSSEGSSGTEESGTTTTSPTEGPVLLWLTDPVTGDFEVPGTDFCENTLVELNAEGLCQGPPVFLVGRNDELLPNLSRSHPFLAMGEVRAVGSGALLAESFDALATTTVTPWFVESLTEPLSQPSTTLALWWGPVEPGDSDSCGGWLNTAGSGATRRFDLRRSSGSPMVRPCDTQHRFLCACPGLP